jgi:hypothetical protein
MFVEEGSRTLFLTFQFHVAGFILLSTTKEVEQGRQREREKEIEREGESLNFRMLDRIIDISYLD